jgi:polysaccharide pyruvyl transferase WcaK-like protein
MRIVAPFGFYGCGNIGDEATLQGFGRLIALSGKRLDVSVGSRDPQHTRLVEPRFRYFRAEGRDWKKWLANRIASAVVVAGGTPIMDCLGDWPLCEVTPLMEAANRRGQPVAFIGVGTERLVRDESRRIVAERLSPCVRAWTVRSAQDQSRLIACGVPPERISVAADMAWLLEPVGREWGQSRLREWGLANGMPVLGVNLVAERAVMEREPRLFEKLATFLDLAVGEFGVRVLFLANEVRTDDTFDVAAARKTRALMKQAAYAFIAPNEYLVPWQMQSVVANCQSILSMRYHFCLFAALQGVPFLALQRSDKVADICSDLAWKYGSPLHDLQPVQLVELFAKIETQNASLKNDLIVGQAALYKRASANKAALDALDERSPIQSATNQDSDP